MSELSTTTSKYSDEDRRKAVVEYCTAGNITKVATNTGIPRTTLNDWVKSDWWEEVVVEVRHEINDQILANNLEIAQKAGERVLDSLENGDEKLIWDKEKGEHVIKRVKPTGKDASVIGGISQDKARVQLGMPTSIQGKSESMQELARQFEELSRQRNEKRINSIDGESEELE